MMEKEWLVGNLHLSAEAISPIEERVSRPELLAGLAYTPFDGHRKRMVQ